MKCENCQGTIIFDEITYENVCSSCGASKPVEPSVVVVENGAGIRTKTEDIHVETQILSVPQNCYPSRYTKIGSERGYIERKMNTVDIHASKSVSRSIGQINYYVNLLSERLGIGHCRSMKERALDIYKRFRPKFTNNLFNSKVLSAVCLYLAIKEFNIPKTFRDIQNAMKKERLAGGKNINSFYKMQFMVQSTLGLIPTQDIPLPLALVSSIAKQIGLAVNIEKGAIQILEELKDEEFMRKHSPHDLAAASLYYVYFHVVQKGIRTRRKDKYLKQDVFANHAKGNLITLRCVLKAIAESHEKKAEKETEPKPILVSVPQLSM